MKIRRALGADIPEDSLAFLEAQADSHFAEAFDLAARSQVGASSGPQWYTLGIKGDRAAAEDWLQRAVARFGVDEIGEIKITSAAWGSRLMAPSSWFVNEFMGRLSLGSRITDSVSYHMHKGFLYEGTGDTPRARAHFDSALVLAEQTGGVGVHTLAAIGEIASAKRQLSIWQSTLDPDNLFRYAFAYLLPKAVLLARDAETHDEAVAILRELSLMEGIRAFTPTLFGLDPGFAHLRDREDFQEMLALY